jgi:hypothetical protein
MMRLVLFILVFALAPIGAQATSQPESLGENGAWSGYTFTENKQKVCYLTGTPKASEGDYTKRGDVFLFITHYPQSNVFDDLYFDMGYPLKKGAEGTVSVEKTSFSVIGDKNHLFSADRKQDKKIINALKQGDTLVVKSVSQKGTKTTDTFDLKGFVKTYQAISKACKKP